MKMLSQKGLIDLLDSTHLVQHVSEPTHGDGHNTDVAVTRQDDNNVRMTSVQSTISDHTALHIHLNMCLKSPRPTRTISFRKIKAIDQTFLDDDIRKSAILRHPAMEPDAMVYQYNSTLRTLLDKHAPLKRKTFPVRQMIPCIGNMLLLLNTTVSSLCFEHGNLNSSPSLALAGAPSLFHR